MLIQPDPVYADELDRCDPLAHFRERFVIADPDLLYLDGNSLGRLPKVAQTLADDFINQQWGERLIRGWNEGWFTLPERIGAKIAQLIGAQPDEVLVAESTSINLLKLAVAGLRFQAGRSRIITDDLNFPSDLYILQSAIELLDRGHQLDMIASPDGIHGPVAALQAALDEQTALLTLSHTVFKSGYMYDLTALTEAAHAAGALVLWDLSHSVGAVPLDLNAAKVDLAVGCCYKYLNGGPGAPAFLYIRRDLQEQLRNPIAGWMGHQDLFQFAPSYQPAAGLRRFLTGTQPLLSLALIEPGVDLLLEAGMDALRAKSIAQTNYLIELWQAHLAPLGFSLNTPRDSRQRGSHVSIGHAEGLRIDLALINDLKVLPDFRAPDNLRLGIAPLYTSYRDIYTSIQRIRQAVTDGLYQQYDSTVPLVT